MYRGHFGLGTIWVGDMLVWGILAGTLLRGHCVREPFVHPVGASIMVSDNKMLVTGGSFKAEYVTLDGSSYGPVMPYDISYVNRHTLVKIDDSQAIFSGGYKYYSGARSKVYYFDIQAETWQEGPDLNTARYGHVSGTLIDSENGQSVVVVAGGKKSSWDVLNSVETLALVSGNTQISSGLVYTCR